MTTTPTAPPRPVTPATLRSVLSGGTRPPHPGPLSVSLTFGWRALLKIKHVPEQLFDVTMFPLMFLLMFTYLFGGALVGSTAEYLQFVLPGILVMTVSMITMYTGLALNTDIQKGIFDRFRSLAIWQPGALVGALLADVARYTMGASVIIGVGMALGFRPRAGIVGLLLGVGLVIVFASSLSWLWTCFGLIARTPESVMFMSMMVLFPLTFVSNVFVDPETMPSWLQPAVDVNPISLLVAAVRGLMHGEPAGGEIGWVLVISAALVAVFAPLTMRLYHRER